MANVLLIILLIISIVMTGLILIQQSEGGALGIGGGGGGGGGFMSGRSAANSVSRMTWILGSAFLVCSLILSVFFNREAAEKGLLDKVEEVSALEETTENLPALSVDPLTTDADSGETTIPLADANEAAETGEEIPADSVDETPAETAETPDDE